MSAPTAVEVFEKALPAIRSGGAGALLDLCADEVVFEFPFAPADRPQRVEGNQAAGEYLSAVASRVQISAADVEKHQTVDPSVGVIEMTVHGTVTDTGEPYDRSYVVVLAVRDGLIVRYRDYWNPMESLRLRATRTSSLPALSL
jgi:uncharacterized protein